jgi:hypothetical protein
MGRFRKYAIGVVFVATLLSTSSSFAAPKDVTRPDTLFRKLKNVIVRILDLNGMSLPPG